MAAGPTMPQGQDKKANAKAIVVSRVKVCQLPMQGLRREACEKHAQG